jgi:hypothetical protein
MNLPFQLHVHGNHKCPRIEEESITYGPLSIIKLEIGKHMWIDTGIRVAKRSRNGTVFVTPATEYDKYLEFKSNEFSPADPQNIKIFITNVSGRFLRIEPDDFLFKFTFIDAKDEVLEAAEKTIVEEAAEEAAEKTIVEEEVEEAAEKTIVEEVEEVLEAVEKTVVEEAVKNAAEKTVVEEEVEKTIVEEAVKNAAEKTVVEEAAEKTVVEEAVKNAAEKTVVKGHKTDILLSYNECLIPEMISPIVIINHTKATGKKYKSAEKKVSSRKVQKKKYVHV